MSASRQSLRPKRGEKGKRGRPGDFLTNIQSGPRSRKRKETHHRGRDRSLFEGKKREEMPSPTKHLSKKKKEEKKANQKGTPLSRFIAVRGGRKGCVFRLCAIDWGGGRREDVQLLYLGPLWKKGKKNEDVTLAPKRRKKEKGRGYGHPALALSSIYLF